MTFKSSSQQSAAVGCDVSPTFTTTAVTAANDDAVPQFDINEEEATWTVREMGPIMFGYHVPLFGFYSRSRETKTLPPLRTASTKAWAALSSMASSARSAFAQGFRRPVLKRVLKRLGISLFWLGLLAVAIVGLVFSISALSYQMPYYLSASSGHRTTGYSLTRQDTYFFKDIRLDDWYLDDHWNYYLFRSEVPEIEQELVNAVVNNSTAPTTLMYEGDERHFYVEASLVEEGSNSDRSWGCKIIASPSTGSDILMGEISYHRRTIRFDLTEVSPIKNGLITLYVSASGWTSHGYETFYSCPGNFKLSVRATRYDLSKADWKCETPRTSCEPAALEVNHHAQIVAVYTGTDDYSSSYHHLQCTLRPWLATLVYGCLPLIMLVSATGFIAMLFCGASVSSVLRRLFFALRITGRRRSGVALPVSDREALLG